ncbi:winged helix-turn-helix domain-containing protein [bacterium]|nr:winged helix-turn-helix domain-containing protein [bacterium]
MSNDSLEAQLRLHKSALQHDRDQILLQIQDFVNKQAEIEKKIEAADILLSEFKTTTNQQIEPQLIPSESVEKNNFVGLTVVEACTTVLLQAKRPMKIAELASAIYDGGIRLKSQAPTRSITVILERNQNFARVAPGTYALVNQQEYKSITQKQSAIRLNKEGALKGSERILKEKGRPMHVREILSALKETGFRSNAKRPEAMLSGTLKRSTKFKLVGGDTWDLVNR